MTSVHDAAPLADERRESDPPGSSFLDVRAPAPPAPGPRYGQMTATLWPDPKAMQFNLDRGENDPHNMQNRHAPLNRRKTDRPD